MSYLFDLYKYLLYYFKIMSISLESYPFLSGNYSPLPLRSEERPIRVTHTIKAGIPEESRKYLDPQVDGVVFPNGNASLHHRIVIPHGVMVAHVDENDAVTLVKNFRHPLGRDSVELPGGGVDENMRPLQSVFEKNIARVIARHAAKSGKSIMDYLDEDQADTILREAAVRETREETGVDIDSTTLERLLPKSIYSSVGFSKHPVDIFYAHGGEKTETHHDDGEAGILTYGRVSIEDAVEMVGYEIIEAYTTMSINALAQMYGKKPSWLPKPYIPLPTHTNT